MQRYIGVEKNDAESKPLARARLPPALLRKIGAFRRYSGAAMGCNPYATRSVYQIGRAVSIDFCDCVYVSGGSRLL
jgi:hypothetical protein